MFTDLVDYITTYMANLYSEALHVNVKLVASG